MVHKAWAVSWAASDTATLTPKLSTITSPMRVPTWTPGQKTRDGMLDAEKSGIDGIQIDSSALFVFIGPPMFSVVILGVCIWCCVLACQSKRRERRVVYVVDGSIHTRTHEIDARVQNGSLKKVMNWYFMRCV